MCSCSLYVKRGPLSTGCAVVAEVPFLPALYLTVSRVHLKNNQQVRPEDPQQALSLSPYIHTVLRTPCGKCSQMWKLRHEETKYMAWSMVVKPTVLSVIAVSALQTPRELTNALKKTHPYSWCCGASEGRQTAAAKSLLLSVWYMERGESQSRHGDSSALTGDVPRVC